MAPFPGLAGRIVQSVHQLGSAAEHINLQPTQTINQVSEALHRRQSAATATVTVVQNSGGGGGSSSLSGGAIAGIVIGSIVGFLLLWWIIYSCGNLGAPSRDRGGSWYDGVRDEGGHYYPTTSSRSGSRRRKSTEVRHVRPVAVVAGSPRQPPYVYERDSRDVRRGRRQHRSASRY